MTADSDKKPTRSKQTTRKRALIFLTVLFSTIGIIWLLYWLIWGRFEEYTDDAYVNGNLVQLMSQISGTVTTIRTDNTLYVEQGQVLIQFDRNDKALELERAEAALANTVRQVRQYFEKAEQAQQTLILRNADLMQAQKDFKRRIGLVGERAISREEMQHYKTATETANARYQTALYQLRAAFALVENSQLYTHPLVEQAKTRLKAAYLDLQRTTVVAPATGYVAKRNVQVGQYVTTNTAMLAIIPADEIWVDANYKESQLNRLRIGQQVTVYADAYPDVTYHGKVFGLTPGTGSAFAVLPPQNATGNWIKIVQRLPVRIALDPKEIKKYPLQIGLSMRVTTNTYHLKGDRLSKVAQNKPIYTTPVYENQLAGANDKIDLILKENSPNVFLSRSAFTVDEHS